MTISRQGSLAALLAVALGTATGVVVADRLGLIQAAQAQGQPLSEEEKRKKEKEKREKEKPRPPPPKPQPPPPPKAPPPPPPRMPPPQPPPKAPLEKPLPPPEKKSLSPQIQQAPPPGGRQLSPGPRPSDSAVPDEKRERFKRQPPGDKGPSPDKGPPPPQQGIAPQPSPGPGPGPGPGLRQLPLQQQQLPPAGRQLPGPSGPATVTPVPQRAPLGPQGPTPQRFDDVQKGRLEKVEDGGKKKIIQEPGNRVIIKQDNQAVIRHDETERFRLRPGAQTERRPNGNTETFYVRRDGVRVVTEVDANGRLLRRYRRGRDGRERNLIDNRRFYRNLAIGVGVGVGLGIIALNLPPPRVRIPRERYIVDYDRASDDDLEEALTASPIEPLDRAYSLEEIRDNYELRAHMRRVDLDTISFDFGQWEVPPDQYNKLERLARVLLRVLERDPDEVFLIEGHTDAVGSDVDNLSLSDRRATAVAQILSDNFGVPEENLVTQGYGEQYLKINTLDPEPLNRRVTVLAIGPLMAERR